MRQLEKSCTNQPVIEKETAYLKSEEIWPVSHGWKVGYSQVIIVKSLIIALVAFKGQASEQLEDRLVYHIKNKASYYRWKRVYWNKERKKR